MMLSLLIQLETSKGYSRHTTGPNPDTPAPTLNVYIDFEAQGLARM
jgi:hypothetical protein